MTNYRFSHFLENYNIKKWHTYLKIINVFYLKCFYKQQKKKNRKEEKKSDLICQIYILCILISEFTYWFLYYKFNKEF